MSLWLTSPAEEDQLHWTGRELFDIAIKQEEPTVPKLLENMALRDKLRSSLLTEMETYRVIPREQRALVADVGALEQVLTVRFDPRMKRHGSPEDLGQPVGGDPLDDRQNQGGGVGRVHQADAAHDVDRFGARSRFPQPIDLLDRAVHRLGGTGLVLFGQAEGHEGPGAGACPGTAQRRGDATGTRRIDSGQPAAESQRQ